VTPDNPRIDDLRRRVQRDPSSVAFAQLAEAYRRAGRYQAAIQLCRAGLAQHPGYLSARVTLGRALIEIGLLDDAQRELEQVVRTAPENLAALQALTLIDQRRPVTVPAHARALRELESWLAAIVRDREERRHAAPIRG
jgi:tetratricopeptide (TPR) repeat protein